MLKGTSRQCPDNSFSRHRVSLLAFFSFALLDSVVHAQGLPGPAEPGRIEERFKEAPRPRAEPELAVPRTEADLPPEKAKSLRFKLTGVVVEGSTVYSETDLLPLYQDKIGNEVSLLEVYRIRDAITTKYRNDGYVLSQAIIPPQKIQGGIVRIIVVEGFIDEVRTEGTVNDSRRLIAQYGKKIKQSRPLHIADLERYVFLIEDLPGVSVRTVLRPSEKKRGAADLILVVEQKLAGGASAEITVDRRRSAQRRCSSGLRGILFSGCTSRRRCNMQRPATPRSCTMALLPIRRSSGQRGPLFWLPRALVPPSLGRDWISSKSKVKPPPCKRRYLIHSSAPARRISLVTLALFIAIRARTSWTPSCPKTAFVLCSSARSLISSITYSAQIGRRSMPLRLISVKVSTSSTPLKPVRPT